MVGTSGAAPEASQAALVRHLLLLLREGSAPGPTPPDFCHASVRVEPVVGRGRGLTVSAPVPAGTLLLACRALALAPRAELQQAVVKRLRVCPQATYERFLCCYEGGDSGERAVPASMDIEGRRSGEELAQDLSSPRKVDAKRVERVLRFNAIAKDTLNEHGAANEVEECGLWLLPSFLNHSCRPNVQLTFLGDWLVCRPSRALEAGEELCCAYVSTFQPLHLRRERLLQDYGFESGCERCVIEEALLPADIARPMLQKLDALVDDIDSGAEGKSLAQAAEAFEQLVAKATKLAESGVKAARTRWEKMDAVREACAALWGRGVAEGGVAEGSRLASSLQRLLSGSFLPAFFGAAFAWRQLGDLGRCVESYQRCLELLEEVSAGSAYHAHWAAECALQAHQHAAGREGTSSSSTDEAVARAARYARRWSDICHGPEAFETLVARHGWPADLVRAAGSLAAAPAPTVAPSQAAERPAEASSAPEVADAAAAAAWGCNVEESSGAVLVSLALPDGVAPADVSLDVAPEHVEATCCGSGSLPLLRLRLPRRVDPARAPPAKFKKSGRRLVLELPLA